MKRVLAALFGASLLIPIAASAEPNYPAHDRFSGRGEYRSDARFERERYFGRDRVASFDRARFERERWARERYERVRWYRFHHSYSGYVPYAWDGPGVGIGLNVNL